MTRRCSHCSNNGHNSRTCPTRGGGGGGGSGGVRLFGVKLTDGSIMKKSASMGNLSAHYHSSSSAAASPNPGSPSSDHLREPVHVPDGYLSDDPAHASCSANRRAERKKGVPWTEEEHRLFLLGLQKLGKGDWRGISRNYVVTRTPTQVASHAQKYFIRQTNATRKKRRSSLFDMVSDMDMATDQQSIHEEQFMLPPPSEAVNPDKSNPQPSLTLSLNPDFESMETTFEESQETAASTGEAPSLIPSFNPAAYVQVPFPLWASNVGPLEENKGMETSSHQVLKPTPIFRKEPVNVDELVGMSELSLGERETGQMEPSQLSLKLLGEPSRQSAFHASTPASVSGTREAVVVSSKQFE